MTVNTSEVGQKIQAIKPKRLKDGKRKSDGLTCSEAEVEAIMSEGESIEV
jgi:hypothetical protein